MDARRRFLESGVVPDDLLPAIANLPELLAVEGIDVFFIGPNDLSHSMGYPAQMHHPEVKAMVKTASATIRAAGKTPGTLVIGQTVAEIRFGGGGSANAAWCQIKADISGSTITFADPQIRVA